MIPFGTERIYVDGDLDLVWETKGPGGAIGMMDRDMVREHLSAVRIALHDVAKRDGADLDNVLVGIAGGTLSYADVEAMAAAATLGRIGGAAKSKAKTTAARANGKLGGRPRKEGKR